MKCIELPTLDMSWRQLVAILLPCLSLLGCAREYEVWYSPGPIQVLASSLVLKRPGSSSSSTGKSATRVRSLGGMFPLSTQLGTNRKWWRQRRMGPSIAYLCQGQGGRDGVSFNPSSNYIFRDNNGFQTLRPAVNTLQRFSLRLGSGSFSTSSIRVVWRSGRHPCARERLTERSRSR